MRQNSQRLEALGVIQDALTQDTSMDVGGIVWGCCGGIRKVRQHLAQDVFEPLYEMVEGSDGEAAAGSWGELAA